MHSCIAMQYQRRTLISVTWEIEALFGKTGCGVIKGRMDFLVSRVLDSENCVVMQLFYK